LSEQRPIQTEDITHSDFTTYIHTLNASISPLDLEIRLTHSQNPHDAATRRPIYALVNSTSDALTQLATIHTLDEIAFVKRVLDAMFEANNTPSKELLAVSSMQALRLAKAPRSRESGVGVNGLTQAAANGETQGGGGGGGVLAGLTQLQADELLDAMVAEGWFELSRPGYYSLAPRALVELRGWLQDTYNEGPTAEDPDAEVVERVRSCEACREIVTVGLRCQTVECGLRLHDGCVGPFFRTVGGERRCPKCQADWTGDRFVGERCLGGRAVQGQGRRSTTGVGRRSGTVVGEEEEEEEDDDADDDDE